MIMDDKVKYTLVCQREKIEFITNLPNSHKFSFIVCLTNRDGQKLCGSFLTKNFFFKDLIQKILDRVFRDAGLIKGEMVD